MSLSLAQSTRRMRNVKQLNNVYAAWHFNLYAQLSTVCDAMLSSMRFSFRIQINFEYILRFLSCQAQIERERER